MLPQNLLRTNSAGQGDHLTVAETGPIETPQVGIGHLVDRAAQPVEQPDPIQAIGQQFIQAMDGRNDPNTIGQFMGAVGLPNQETLQTIGQDVSTLITKVTTGEIVADFQDALAGMEASQAYADWSAGVNQLAGVDQSLRGDDRAAAGVSALIDEFTRNPAGAVMGVFNAAGGPARLVTDPLGFIRDAGVYVLGPDTMQVLRNNINDVPGAIYESLLRAAPALLIPLAAPVVGLLTGAPLGALALSGPGALLGALNPLNLLGMIPGALAGIPLGALATGIPGFLGSLLLTLPATVIAPLLGAAGGSVIALALWATAVFGTYGVLYALGALGIFGIAAIAGLAAGGIGWALSLFNPFAFLFAAAFGWGVFFEVLFIGGLGLVITTAWIPILIYALGFLPVLLTGMLTGFGLGALAGLLIPAIGIPLLTALSALPGAIIGGLLGSLAGWAGMTLLNTLLGAGLGALAGLVLGGLIGAGLFSLGSIPVALALAGFLIGQDLMPRLGALFNGPDSIGAKLRAAFDRGWRESNFGKMLGSLAHAFGATESGMAFNDLANRLNSLYMVVAFLENRRVREMLLRGGILGAIPGGLIGGLLGGLIGAPLGFFNPLNLLNGLMGALAGSIPGGLLGALAGGLLAPLLGSLAGLASIPLTFLPNLALLALGLGALLLPLALAAGAATIIPPLVMAVATTFLVGLLLALPWSVPLFLVAAAMSVFALILGNPLLWIPTLGIAPLISFIVGSIALGIAIGNTIAVFALLGLVALTIGVATFFILLPFFAFPALTLALAGLASLPALLPMALGLSLLEAIAIGTAATALSSLLTVPAGALMGALLGAGIGGTLGTLTAAITRALLYGAAGMAAGSGIGAGIGGLLGALTALVTHLRLAAGMDQDVAWWDVRLLNRGGFGDSLSWIPGLTGEARQVSPRAIPAVAHIPTPV
ncbi:hypothetical protein [Corynebacterium mastitidis]|uniref:hypothetical protein n=1 Tax=Corynebacterium mastitidis TaxID=161890 RepID=UPI00037C955F|nr:hypothetical protein [Corynebacterium mastitidis]